MRHAMLACSVVIGIIVAGCGDDATKADPCPRGICVGTTSSGDGGGGASSSGSSGGGCNAAWTCSPWEKNPDGKYARMCTDANNCGSAAGKPSEGPVDLPNLDMDFYKCKVEPIFDRGCAMQGCHGTEVGRPFKVYARGKLRNKEMVPPASSCLDTGMQDLAEKGTGTVMCLGWSPHTQTEWQRNYDNARSFMVGITNPDESELLAQPVYQGKAHAGVHLFAKTDADYKTIADWLGGAKLGSVCNPLPN